MPKDKEIKPINASLDDVADSLLNPAPHKNKRNNNMEYAFEAYPAPSSQLVLDLNVQVQKDINGIEMGVLENGIPFLTQVGLAKISGVSRSVIYDISQEWEKQFDSSTIGKDRNSFLKQYLFENGYSERKLFIETKKDGSVHYAYPDIVCMAVLEFYSFEYKTQIEAINHE